MTIPVNPNWGKPSSVAGAPPVSKEEWTVIGSSIQPIGIQFESNDLWRVEKIVETHNAEVSALRQKLEQMERLKDFYIEVRDANVAMIEQLIE